MNLHHLIKRAINDPELRSRLFTQPQETCEQFGIPVKIASLPLEAKSDTRLIQGAYRP